MKSVNLRISTCTECPHFRSERDYTEDSFKYCFIWICNFEKKTRIIQRYVDWSDNKKYLPDWCPLAKLQDTIIENPCAHIWRSNNYMAECVKCGKTISSECKDK